MLGRTRSGNAPHSAAEFPPLVVRQRYSPPIAET
jgi:hypothetical protein